MIFQYNPVKVGMELRKIREDRNYSRKAVSIRSSISVESIRKIEKGLVLPQLQTLMDLSNYYNYDLFSLISSTLKKNYHNAIYDISDNLLQICKSAEIDYNENLGAIVDAQEIERLKKYQSFLRDNSSEVTYCPSKAIEGIHKLIIEKHPNFSEKSILSELVLNTLDIKILVTYASLLGDVCNYIESLNLTEQLEIILSKLDNDSLSVIKLFVKNKCLQAYNYHSLDKHQIAINICTAGINYCKEKNTNYYLYYLHYRRAIGYLKLNDARYETEFHKVRVLLEAYDDYMTLDYLAKVTYDKYKEQI